MGGTCRRTVESGLGRGVKRRFGSEWQEVQEELVLLNLEGTATTSWFLTSGLEAEVGRAGARGQLPVLSEEGLLPVGQLPPRAGGLSLSWCEH